MTAYVIVELLQMKDEAGMAEYGAGIANQMRALNARVIARGFDVIEGRPEGTLRVLLEFPSVQSFKDWQSAPEYRDLKQLRLASADINLIAVPGIESEKEA
jgi:uncharacterized protein (DUF1330 family)